MYDSRSDKARGSVAHLDKECKPARKESTRAHRREARFLITTGQFDLVSTRFTGTSGWNTW